MPVATATAEEAGTYEVRVDFDVLVDIGDRCVVREGDCRVIFWRRRPGAWALPVYDWRPEDVRRGWVARVSDSTDEATVEAYTKVRADQYFAAFDEHHMDLHAADLRRRAVREAVRERAVKVIRDVPDLPMSGILDFFLGRSDQTVFPGRASYRWWSRVDKIGRYVHARILEAQDAGMVEPLHPSDDDSHPRGHMWRATEASA